MGQQIQREIERGDARDRTERKALHDTPAASGELLPVERQVFAIDARAFLRRDCKCEDGALDFRTRRLDGLTRFLAQRAREFFFPLRDPFGNPPQHPLPLERRQAPGSAECLYCSGDGSLRMLAPTLVYAPDDGAIVRGFHLHQVAFFDPSAVYQEAVSCDVCDRHLCHMFGWTSHPQATPTVDYRLS